MARPFISDLAIGGDGALHTFHFFANVDRRTVFFVRESLDSSYDVIWSIIVPGLLNQVFFACRKIYSFQIISTAAGDALSELPLPP